MAPDQRFRKSERLCRKKYIDELFLSGKSFRSYPFRLVWMPVEDKLPFRAQLGISVQKRIFRKAVHRNRIKRRIREAYRKNKSEIYITLKEHDIHIAFMLIYTATSILDSKEIEGKIIVILRRLKEVLERSVNEGA